MGTELVAPLLYDLARLTRPQRLLEVGMGYTTPFLARALHDARIDAYAEAKALATKGIPTPASRAKLNDKWLERHPTFASPAFHAAPYEPQLVVLDDFSVERSSATSVLPILKSLELDDLVVPVHSSLQDIHTSLDPKLTPFDFVWVDAWACLYFFENCWDLVSDPGGIALFHYLIGYEEGDAIIDYMKATQQMHPDELEILSLIEPHKLRQNSLTLVRRIASRGNSKTSRSTGDAAS
jgi:hypothetical protein